MKRWRPCDERGEATETAGMISRHARTQAQDVRVSYNLHELVIVRR
jgi:hypothetical protein